MPRCYIHGMTGGHREGRHTTGTSTLYNDCGSTHQKTYMIINVKIHDLQAVHNRERVCTSMYQYTVRGSHRCGEMMVFDATRVTPTSQVWRDDGI